MAIIDINTLFGAFPAQHSESTADSLVEAITKQGVAQALTLSTWGVHYHDMAGNQETLRACQDNSAQLIPVGTVNPTTFWEADEILRHIAQTSFSVFYFFPAEQHWPIDYAPFHRILTIVAETAPPIMVTIGQPGDATQLARTIADYPAPVVMIGADPRTVVEALTVMRSVPQLRLETHQLIMPDGLGRIRDAVGADRILFGSGGPALSIRAALDYVRKSSLTDSERDAVLGGNASAMLQGVS